MLHDSIQQLYLTVKISEIFCKSHGHIFCPISFNVERLCSNGYVYKFAITHNCLKISFNTCTTVLIINRFKLQGNRVEG